jgi:hypothetical protein
MKIHHKVTKGTKTDTKKRSTTEIAETTEREIERRENHEYQLYEKSQYYS